MTVKYDDKTIILKWLKCMEVGRLSVNTRVLGSILAQGNKSYSRTVFGAVLSSAMEIYMNQLYAGYYIKLE